MGGNALAPFGARRYPAKEYHDISYKILNTLWPIVPNEIAIEIPSYFTKDSFGDMDILVQGPWTPEDYMKVIQAFEKHNNTDKLAPYVKNGDVMSILFEELQVDLLPMPEEDLDTAHMYYSYNDLGNLMGKLFHKFGLKYGHRGLTYPMRDGTNQYDEIMVSKDSDEIFSFMGLSYTKFCRGFKTLEDIFEFVKSSKYYSPEPYQYENLNHANRIRDKKRTTYHGFLEYIKVNPCKATYVFNEDKSTYIPHIQHHFYGFEEKYKESLAKLAFRREVRAKLNGEMITEWTGHTGIKLSKLMFRIKDQWGDFSKWVLTCTDEEIHKIVMAECEDFDTFERMSTMDFANLPTRLAMLEARKKANEYQDSKAI